MMMVRPVLVELKVMRAPLLAVTVMPEVRAREPETVSEPVEPKAQVPAKVPELPPPEPLQVTVRQTGLVLMVTLPVPLFESKMTKSVAAGTPALPLPPEEVAQLVVVELFQVPAPLTQYQAELKIHPVLFDTLVLLVA